MSQPLADDRISAFRGRMGEVMNAVKDAATKKAGEQSQIPAKVLNFRNSLQFKERARKFRRLRPETDMDSASLVALAMDRLTPALLRASIIGVPVTVEVPDEQTAEIFRAALEKTRSGRPTDRLVEVVAKT